MANTLESRVKHAGRPPLPEDEIRRIIGSHSIYNGNAKETARQLGYHWDTVIKYWNEKGLRVLGRQGRYAKFKTPLDFFRSCKRYKNLTRSELAQEDLSLYRTLLRHRQLEDAIPQVKRKGRLPLSKKEIDGIVQIYYQAKQIKITAEITGYSLPTISKYLISRRVIKKRRRKRKASN